jgi:hypothetical protein
MSPLGADCHAGGRNSRPVSAGLGRPRLTLCRFEEETRLEVGSPGVGGVLALVWPQPLLVFGIGGAWQPGGGVEASREE